MSETIVVLLAYLTQSLGSLGCAILTLSMGIRIALLPLTIKLARRAQRNQEKMRVLQPEIEELKRRFEKKPERLFEEIGKLYRKHDCSPFDIPTLVGSCIQLPIFGILYSGIRNSLGSNSAFLWIKSLAAPDFLLTLVILTFTAVSTHLMPSASAQMKTTLMSIQVVVTFIIVWKLAAGLGLYWASSSVVGLFQTLWLRFRNDVNRMA
jgi:YidC/Oxa1 family membrane protein insertase